jgi:membrane protein
MYFVVPEEPVRFISATKAGIIAATLLEIIKHAMFFYIQYFNFYEVIYGTLSVLMMVIIWIYLAWVIVLFGANFCYCLEDK